MITDGRGSTWTDKHTHVFMSKDGHGSTCMYARGSTCTEVSTESMGVHGSTRPSIPTKYTGVHRVMCTNDSMIKAVVRGRTNAYGKYGRYKPKWYIGTDVLGKVQKGIIYADALQKGS